MDAAYWNQRYLNEQTGWDIGYPNLALTHYVESRGLSKDSEILIPGAGRAYEAEYLHHKGYSSVYIIDLAPEAKNDFLKRVSHFPNDHFIVGDFFELNQSFDLILEQTFFCALDPKLRPLYAEHMHKIIRPDGVLAGVLFNMQKEDGPPFGGNEIEYRSLFEPDFEIVHLEECYNSIPPRAGREFFIEFKPKKTS